MRWTTKGLETMLNLILTRYVSEESYVVLKHKMMKSDNVKFIKGEVEVISAGGEFKPKMKHHRLWDKNSLMSPISCQIRKNQPREERYTNCVLKPTPPKT